MVEAISDRTGVGVGVGVGVGLRWGRRRGVDMGVGVSLKKGVCWKYRQKKYFFADASALAAALASASAAFSSSLFGMPHGNA